VICFTCVLHGLPISFSLVWSFWLHC
jgi:hypothetical protein